MNIDYKVSSFLHLHNDFIYNSLGSTCTYHHLLVGRIHTWELGPCWRMSQTCEEDFKDGQGCPFPWPPPLETSKGAPAKVEAQTDSTSSLIRSPRAFSNKTDAQVANGVGFGRSLYGWKDNLKSLQAQIHPESMGIVRGIRHPVSVPALRRRLSVFGPCIVLEPIRDASRGLARP